MKYLFFFLLFTILIITNSLGQIDNNSPKNIENLRQKSENVLTAKNPVIIIGIAKYVEDDSTITDLNKVQLKQNEPNPCLNFITKIPFYLPDEMTVSLDIYDKNGNLAKQVLNGVVFTKGDQMVTVDLTGLAQGHYEYRLIAGGKAYTKMLILLR
jgi:hypothetical protein